MLLPSDAFDRTAIKVVDEVIIGAPWHITGDLIQSFKISCVVRGTRIDSNLIDSHRYEHTTPGGSATDAQVFNTTACGNSSFLDRDPYEVPKLMGIYREIDSQSCCTTREIIRRIWANRNALMKSLDIRAGKEISHYSAKARTGTVAEV